MIGELLSGSSPPAEFFHPFSIAVLSALYGSGAVLARELAVRWRKGWPSLLVLGAAYGIVEEGLMVKSFFDPNWMDLGILGEYGRFGGVNWVWSLDLTIYHAVFSITVPVLLVELAFPEQKDTPWLGRRGLRILSLLLAADVAFGFFALTPYRPPAAPYLLAAAAALGLVVLARRLPAARVEAADEHPDLGRPFGFLAAGFAATLGFFLLLWVAPHTGIAPGLLIALTAAYAGGVWLAVRALARRGPLPAAHRLALAAGALGFFILLAPLQELDPTRIDNTGGMTIVAGAASVLLIWLNRRIRAEAFQSRIRQA
jgi:hypothetical protein